MAPKRQRADEREPGRLRVNVSINAELRRRLGAYAGAHRCTEGQVIERALERELAGFYFGQREPRATVTVSSAPEDGAPGVLPIRAG